MAETKRTKLPKGSSLAPDDICLWTGCKRKVKFTWLCKLHYLAKEANYGLNDTDPENTHPGKQPGGDFYQWGVERLREFAIYVIDNRVI